jgi:hypothetical protein
MLTQTTTHYFPHDDSDEVAYCGHRMTDADVHSPEPTCLTCTVRQAAEDHALDAALDQAMPLDADEARIELDPILNADIPARPLSPLGQELFALGRTLAVLELARVRR